MVVDDVARHQQNPEVGWGTGAKPRESPTSKTTNTTKMTKTGCLVLRHMVCTASHRPSHLYTNIFAYLILLTKAGITHFLCTKVVALSLFIVVGTPPSQSSTSTKKYQATTSVWYDHSLKKVYWTSSLQPGSDLRGSKRSLQLRMTLAELRQD